MELIERIKQSLQTIINAVSPYLKQSWELFNDYDYLRAGLLVLVGYFFAKLLSKYIPKLLIKLAKKIKFKLGEAIIKLAPPIIFQVTFLVSLALVSHLLTLSKTQSFIALASIQSLIIIFVIIFIYRLVKLFLKRLSEKENKEEASLVQPATLPLFENMTVLLLVLGGVHQIFGAWDIDLTALMASAGILGLAIGMASKDTLSDVIAGILILTDAPYRVGDVIQVGDQVGTVTHIGIRSTRILTRNNVGITVPNGKIGTSEVINESTTEDSSLRIQLPISAAYGIEPAVLREILMTAAKETQQVQQHKKIRAVLSDVQTDQVTFTLICWVADPTLKSDALFMMREKIYLRFLKDNIPISAPDRREIAITEQADLIQQVAITSLPPLEQSISINTLPKLDHSIAIKEMPDRNGTLSIKEIPDLFGSKQPRKIKKAKKMETTPEPKG
ncbi:MAG: mechanosensitive ion channel family protein [Cocleimonas sp.]|nr:mechanosensitive ion channel family protein [Cocleimonas sp.]